MKGIFSIIIPAYNEESSVVGILNRSLAAAPEIRAALGFSEVEVLLVDDGSLDRTAELARGVRGVRVISCPVNRGYGAAIKTGFQEARGDWLGFLDADGTCAPAFFAELLRLAEDEGCDVALGSRMHPGSRMPVVRRLGNWIFRTLLRCIAGGALSDTASGMRVLRRDALQRLYPLPDGLSFTPAMSVRAVLDPRLKIGEKPMPYEERIGRSKLSVVKDGLRFLGVILQTAATYRPSTFFGFSAALLAAASLPFLLFRLGGPAAPLSCYLANGRIEDWMIFRLILVTVLLGASVFLLSLGLVAQTLVDIIHHGPDPFAAGGWRSALMRRFPLWGIISLLLAAWINHRPLASYFATGQIPVPGQGQEFWVFPVVGAMFALIGFELLAFSAVIAIARLLWERERCRGGAASDDS
ncbi:MAG: glycosyltransferase family 2 protein [Elusimicrobia bacterium]|nr:glycosyltransferase family 2 protein [Elusimicrobiota bacterium]